MSPPSLIPDLEAQVRRVDEDRWLASRFAPADVRARLVTLYALNDEIARSGEVVSQPALADIRFAWWRDALAEIYAGKSARAHPVLAAFVAADGASIWPQAMFETLIEARAADLEARPLASWAALDARVADTAGIVLRLAILACNTPLSPEIEAFVEPAAHAWGLVAWARAGRALPSGKALPALLDRAAAAYAEARTHLFAPALFPAAGYVALVPGYARALRAGRRDRALLARQLRLIGATASGRF